MIAGFAPSEPDMPTKNRPCIQRYRRGIGREPDRRLQPLLDRGSIIGEAQVDRFLNRIRILVFVDKHMREWETHARSISMQEDVALRCIEKFAKVPEESGEITSRSVCKSLLVNPIRCNECCPNTTCLLKCVYTYLVFDQPVENLLQCERPVPFV